MVTTNTTEAIGIRSGGAFMMENVEIVNIWQKKTVPAKSIDLLNDV